MISARPLALEVSTYQALRGRLLKEWPELDEETLADSLEGITELHEMIAAVIRSALVDEALQAGLRLRLDGMRERLSRLEVRAVKKRQLALEAMSEVGFTKLEQPDFTASTRAGSCALIVIAEDKIPNIYWVLRSASRGNEKTFDQPSAFVAALRQAMSEALDIELLFAIWEQNVETVRTLNRSLKHDSLSRSGIAPQLVAHLKHCAVALVKPENRTKEPETISDQRTHNGAGAKIDKSVLTISEPKRIRSKEHLRHVAQQPCLICGRSPSHAHHIRFAQSKGLGLKVSDEFTVPLCAIHHQQNHATGNERLWWQEHQIDPLAVALRLWRESTKHALPGEDPVGPK